MLCCHPPQGIGEPSEALGDPGEWRRRKRRRKAAAVYRDPAIARSMAVRSEHDTPERPGQDLASSRSPGSLRSWTRGGGGTREGLGGGGPRTSPAWLYL